MLNYIRAELYRNFNRVYFWCMTGSLAAFALLCVVISKNALSLTDLFGIGIKCLILPVFLVSMIIEMVTAEEQKNQTLKNVVSFGISRNKLVLSKLIVTVILSVISAIIILAVYFGSGAIFLKAGKDFSLDVVKIFTFRLLSAVPLWIGAISIGNFLAFAFRNNTVFAFVYAGLFVILNQVIKLLSMLVSDKFNYVYNILITTQLKNLGEEIATGHNLMAAVFVGIVYTIILTISNILYFRNMEVK